MGKATNSKFCMHIHSVDRNKSPLKISAKVTVGVLRDSGKFSGHPYIGRIARSSFLLNANVRVQNSAARLHSVMSTVVSMRKRKCVESV